VISSSAARPDRRAHPGHERRPPESTPPGKHCRAARPRGRPGRVPGRRAPVTGRANAHACCRPGHWRPQVAGRAIGARSCRPGPWHVSPPA